jgi:hypothetical protein
MGRYIVTKKPSFIWKGEQYKFNADHLKIDDAGNAIFYDEHDAIVVMFHPDQFDFINSGEDFTEVNNGA